MISRRRRALVTAVVVASGLVALALGLRDRGSDEPPSTAEVLALDGPERIDAGAPWPIELAEITTSEAHVEVDVIGPWGVRRVTVAEPGGRTVVVPGELTRRSGRLVALVRVGDAAGRIDVDVLPGPAVDGAVPLAGPRSIVADGRHQTMVTSFPRDRYGNVVADGTVVTVQARRPDGGRTSTTTEVSDLLAAVRVGSQTTTGRTTLRVDVDGSTGPEVEVLEVPGPPTDVTLVPPDGVLRADGRTLVTVTSGLLTDRFGNVLLDGVVAVTSLDGPVGRGTARSFTLGGRVELVIEAPAAPGTMTVDTVVDGVRSRPVRLEFLPDVSALPVAVEPGGLVVGPVLTSLGGYAPDGTDVLVRSGRTTWRGELRDGVANVEFDRPLVGSVEVEVLGVEVTVAVGAEVAGR